MLNATYILKVLRGKEKVTGLKEVFVKQATGSFALNVVSVGLSLGLNILLARLLGVAAYGDYTYVMSWIILLSVPAILGQDRLLVRHVATYYVQSDWRLLNGVLKWTSKTVLLVSLALSAIVALIIYLLREQIGFHLLLLFWLGLVTVPLTALTRVRQAALRGLRQVVIGRLPDTLIRPIIMVAFIGIAYLLIRDRLDATWAIGANVFAVAVSFVVGVVMLLRCLPDDARNATPAFQKQLWKTGIFAMTLIGTMQVLGAKIDILILGALKGTEAVGIYNVANRGVQFITFAIISINAILGPTVASLYSTGEMNRLQRVVTKSSRVILITSLPVALGFIIFGRWFLLLFGQEFVIGQTALIILSVGWLIDATMGSVGLLLTMTGHERDFAISMALSLVLNVLLDFALIPNWGLNGASVASATSLVVMNLLLAGAVYRRMGIHATAFGPLTLQR